MTLQTEIMEALEALHAVFDRHGMDRPERLTLKTQVQWQALADLFRQPGEHDISYTHDWRVGRNQYKFGGLVITFLIETSGDEAPPLDRPNCLRETHYLWPDGLYRKEFPPDGFKDESPSTGIVMPKIGPGQYNPHNSW